MLLLLAGLIFLWRGGVTNPELLEGAFLLTLMPLLSPQGWDYVFLIATPAVALVVNDEDRLPQPLRALTIVALLQDDPDLDPAQHFGAVDAVAERRMLERDLPADRR